MSSNPIAPIHGSAYVRGGLTIEICCRRCRRPFVPSSEAVRSGPPHYWYCPQCRPPAPAPTKKSEVAA